MSPLEPDVPPAGEELHLPGGSIQPVLLAFFIAVAIVGVTTTIYMVIVGVIASVWIIIAWIRDTRREISELPLDHH